MLMTRWKMKPKLKILINHGWIIMGVAGRNLVILRKGNGEIVYSVATKQIIEITPCVGDLVGDIDEED